jgi:hypothetical protein
VMPDETQWQQPKAGNRYPPFMIKQLQPSRIVDPANDCSRFQPSWREAPVPLPPQAPSPLESISSSIFQQTFRFPTKVSTTLFQNSILGFDVP